MDDKIDRTVFLPRYLTESTDDAIRDANSGPREVGVAEIES